MASGGIITTDIVSEKNFDEANIKKGYYSIRQHLQDDLLYAVTDGIANSNLGDAFRSLASSLAMGKANSYGSTILSNIFSGKGLSGIGGALGGFVGSIAISAIANNWEKWFGDKNKKETMASNAETKERYSKAYLNTYAAELNPFMTDELLSNLYQSRTLSAYVSWKSSSRGGLAGAFGGKNYTDTTPQWTFDNIKAIEDAVDAVNTYNDREERRLELLDAQGYSYQVLTEQLNALSSTMDRIYWMGDNFSTTSSWTSGEKFSIDLTDNIQDLKKAYYEALREYGQETGARNTQKANTFLALYPYLDNFAMGTYYDGSPYSSSRVNVRWQGEVNDNAEKSYEWIKKYQEEYMNKEATPLMFHAIQAAGLEQYRIASLQYSDPSKYQEEYLNLLQRQMDAAKTVMDEQEDIYHDLTKTFEEQSAALETYQHAQDTYYNTKLEILAQEQAKEEQIKKEEAAASLRRQEKMEALLGFTGEIAKTGNKIYILEGADQVGALKELMQECGDDPEALAALQAMLSAAQNKAKYGKIG